MPNHVIAVGLGGMIGALLRYSIQLYLPSQSFFPYSTLLVNLLGCTGLGLLWGASEKSGLAGPSLSFWMIGLLGSFTTFSTVAKDTLLLCGSHGVGWGLFYIMITNTLGLLCASLGYFFLR